MFFSNLVYLLLFLICFCSIIVVLISNPIFSIFFLILVFFLASICLFLLSVEFLGLLYIIIYVGAIAILFLFVIMLIDLSSIKKNIIINNNFKFFLILPSLILLSFFFFEQFLLLDHCSLNFPIYNLLYQSWLNILNINFDIILIGTLIYTTYFFSFLLLTLLFFIALIGAILLIYRVEFYFKNDIVKIKFQDISDQVSRTNLIFI